MSARETEAMQISPLKTLTMPFKKRWMILNLSIIVFYFILELHLKGKHILFILKCQFL